MDEVWRLSWRAWPATSMMAAGLVVALLGTWRQRHWLVLPASDGRKGSAMVRALRAVLAGGALAGVGASWLWQWPVAAFVAVVIGLEELWETSVVVGALDDARRRGTMRV